jgi:hypothetical protein
MPPTARPIPEHLLARPELTAHGRTLALAFTEAATAVGCEVHATTPETLPPVLERLLADHAPVARLDLDPSPTAAPFSYGACVVRPTLAIAASGSFLLEGTNLPAMTAPLLIALIDESTLVPTLLDALRAARSTPLPPSRLIVTGPSKTADIEGTLVTGVHGPERVIAILTRNAENQTS